MDLSFLFRIVTNFVIQGFLIYEFCSCLKAAKFPVIVASFSFVRLFCMNCCNDNHIKSLHLILLSCMSYFLSCFDYTCILLVLKLCFGFSYIFTLNITEKTYKLSNMHLLLYYCLWLMIINIKNVYLFTICLCFLFFLLEIQKRGDVVWLPMEQLSTKRVNN